MDTSASETKTNAKRYLYHRTPKENLQSIFKQGLHPNPNFVCLCEDPSLWFTDYACLSVNIESFMKENPNVRITTWLPELDEICVWGMIPPKYIKECDNGHSL